MTEFGMPLVPADPPKAAWDFVRYGRWHTVEFCAKCQNRLSSDEKRFSAGVCPYCGKQSYRPNRFNSDLSALSKICETRAKAFRRVRYYRRRAFWFPLLVDTKYEERQAGQY